MTAPAPPDASRSAVAYRAVFAAGLVLLGVSFLAPLVHGLAVSGSVPGLHYDALTAGREALARRDLAVAYREFHTAALIQPSADALSGLGDVLLEQRRLDEAVAAYAAALSLRPRDAWVHDRIAVAYGLAGQIEAAARHFEIALSLDPQMPGAERNLRWARAELAKRRASAP